VRPRAIVDEGRIAPSAPRAKFRSARWRSPPSEIECDRPIPQATAGVAQISDKSRSTIAAPKSRWFHVRAPIVEMVQCSMRRHRAGRYQSSVLLEDAFIGSPERVCANGSLLGRYSSNMRHRARPRRFIFNTFSPLIFFLRFAELFHPGTGKHRLFRGPGSHGILGNGLWGAGMRACRIARPTFCAASKYADIAAPILVASMASGLLLYLPVIALMPAGAHHLRHAAPAALDLAGVDGFRGVCAFARSSDPPAVTNTMAEANI